MTQTAGNEIRLSDQTRLYIFYGLFAAILAIYLVFVSLYYISTESSASLANFFFTVAPLIQEQSPFAASFLPLLLAVVGGATAPDTTDRRHFFAILGLAGLTWIAYLHLGAIISIESRPLDPALGETEWRKNVAALGVSPNDALSSLRSYASSVRDLAAVVVAAVLGIAINREARTQATPAQPSTPPEPVAIASEHQYEGPPRG